MTLKEAQIAARKRVPIVSDGITYARIEFVGYKYTEDGREIPSVRLLDKCGHSVTDAAPLYCELAETVAVAKMAEEVSNNVPR